MKAVWLLFGLLLAGPLRAEGELIQDRKSVV